MYGCSFRVRGRGRYRRLHERRRPVVMVGHRQVGDIRRGRAPGSRLQGARGALCELPRRGGGRRGGIQRMDVGAAPARKRQDQRPRRGFAPSRGEGRQSFGFSSGSLRRRRRRGLHRVFVHRRQAGDGTPEGPGGGGQGRRLRRPRPLGAFFADIRRLVRRCGRRGRFRAVRADARRGCRQGRGDKDSRRGERRGRE